MKVKYAEYEKDYEIRILFNNGKVKIVDFAPFLKGSKGLLKELEDLNYFKSFRVDDTTLSWPNEMDFCPNMLYNAGIPTKNKFFKSDTSKVAKAIWKGLTENNTDLILHSLNEYLNMINKSEFSKDSGISKRTLFHALKSKNPTIKTLCKIVSQIAKGEDFDKEEIEVAEDLDYDTFSKELKRVVNERDGMLKRLKDR